MLGYCRDSNFDGGFHGAFSVPSLLMGFMSLGLPGDHPARSCK